MDKLTPSLSLKNRGKRLTVHLLVFYGFHRAPLTRLSPSCHASAPTRARTSPVDHEPPPGSNRSPSESPNRGAVVPEVQPGELGLETLLQMKDRM